MFEEDSLQLLNCVEDRMVFGVRYMFELVSIRPQCNRKPWHRSRFQAGIGISFNPPLLVVHRGPHSLALAFVLLVVSGRFVNHSFDSGMGSSRSHCTRISLPKVCKLGVRTEDKYRLLSTVSNYTGHGDGLKVTKILRSQ